MTLVLSDFLFLLRFCVLAAPFQRTRNIRIRPYAFFDYTASRGSLFQVLFNNAASSFWKRHLPVSSDSKFSVWEKSNLKAPPPHTEEHEKVDVFGDTTSGRNESSPTQACDLMRDFVLWYGMDITVFSISTVVFICTGSVVNQPLSHGSNTHSR